MAEEIHLTIDGTEVAVAPGTTLREAAERLQTHIPVICYHEATTSNGLCRMCVVEVEGARTLAPACVALAVEGMKIQTGSERVRRARRTILEMLESTVDLSEAPEIQAYASEYAADPQRFPDADRRALPVYDDNPMYIRDYSKCVLCWRCVQVCADDAQYTYALNFTGRGFDTEIGTFFGEGMPATTCVFCGQCVGVCPTGALKPKREWLLEQGIPADEIMEMTRSERRRRRK